MPIRCLPACARTPGLGTGLPHMGRGGDGIKRPALRSGTAEPAAGRPRSLLRTALVAQSEHVAPFGDAIEKVERAVVGAPESGRAP